MRRSLLLIMAPMLLSNASAEEFRAECTQTLSIVNRGHFDETSNSYVWEIEDDFTSSEALTYLVFLDLPNRELDWIEVFKGRARSSSFMDGKENPFSIVLGDATMDVMGERLSYRSLEDPTTEWTFVFDGTGKAKLRRTASNNTITGSMIVVDHADCTLSGTATVLLRSKNSSPSPEFAEKFWSEVESGFHQQGNTPTKQLEHTD